MTTAQFRFTAATVTFDPSAAMRQAQEIVGDEWTVTAAEPVGGWRHIDDVEFRRAGDPPPIRWTAEVYATVEQVTP